MNIDEAKEVYKNTPGLSDEAKRKAIMYLRIMEAMVRDFYFVTAENLPASLRDALIDQGYTATVLKDDPNGRLITRISGWAE
jgi:hypothetical protein